MSIRIKLHCYSHRQSRRCFTSAVADGLDGSHGSVDQSHVHPQVGGQHDMSTNCMTDDGLQSRCIIR